MEKDNEKTKLYIIIIILSILVIVLSSYIVISKYSNKTENIDNKPETIIPEEDNTTEDDEDEGYIEEANDVDEILDYIVNIFPKPYDSEATGDNIFKEFNLEKNERHSKKFTNYYKNYKIIYKYNDGSVDSSELTIYNGEEKVYFNDNVKSFISTINGKTYNILPTVSNGKLHFIAYNPKKCYLNNEGQKAPYFNYIQIDLTSNKIDVKTIKSAKFELANIYTPEGAVVECKEKNQSN